MAQKISSKCCYFKTFYSSNNHEKIAGKHKCFNIDDNKNVPFMSMFSKNDYLSITLLGGMWLTLFSKPFKSILHQ